MFGILNLDKPAGVTSRDVVNVVQKLVKPVKVGHAGTLDPMATGVLVVCLGQATRLIQKIQTHPKSYVAEFTLGQTSDTDDCTGNVVTNDCDAVPLAAIRTALGTFVGRVLQTPPAYSAVKINGQRAYKMARDGQTVELSAKEVHIHSLTFIHYEWPKLIVDVSCGSGTYIRSIARDLGKMLGVGGLMSALQRTRIGPFSVQQALNPDSLTVESITESLTDPLHLFQGLPRYSCPDCDLAKLSNGNFLTVRQDKFGTPGDVVPITNAAGDRLIALGEFHGQNRLQPRQVFLSD